MLIRLCVSLVLLLASPTLLAHTGTSTQGFGAGLVHPFSGLDHLLAMVAVGLWAAQAPLGRASRWLMPLAFLTAFAFGMGGGLLGSAAWEPGLGLSVAMLGLAIAAALRPPRPLVVVLTAAFGFVHGQAHGAEMPPDRLGLAYACGVLAATLLLHVAGVFCGGLIARRHAPLLRMLGGGILGAGVALLAGH